MTHRGPCQPRPFCDSVTPQHARRPRREAHAARCHHAGLLLHEPAGPLAVAVAVPAGPDRGLVPSAGGAALRPASRPRFVLRRHLGSRLAVVRCRGFWQHLAGSRQKSLRSEQMGRLAAASGCHGRLQHPPVCLGTWIPLEIFCPCHWAACFCRDIVSDPSFCYVLPSRGFAAYKRRFGSWKGELVSQCRAAERRCAALAEPLAAAMPFPALFSLSQDAGGCRSHREGHRCVLLRERKHGVVPGCVEGLECQRLWRFLPGLRRAGKAGNLHAKKKVVLVVLGTEARRKAKRPTLSTPGLGDAAPESKGTRGAWGTVPLVCC